MSDILPLVPIIVSMGAPRPTGRGARASVQRNGPLHSCCTQGRVRSRKRGLRGPTRTHEIPRRPDERTPLGVRRSQVQILSARHDAGIEFPVLIKPPTRTPAAPLCLKGSPAPALAAPKGCTPLWELTAASSGVILKQSLSIQLTEPGETVATDRCTTRIPDRDSRWLGIDLCRWTPIGADIRG